MSAQLAHAHGKDLVACVETFLSESKFGDMDDQVQSLEALVHAYHQTQQAAQQAGDDRLEGELKKFRPTLDPEAVDPAQLAQWQRGLERIVVGSPEGKPSPVPRP